MNADSKSFLFELLQTPSPTGFEIEGQKVWANYVRPFADSVEIDGYGNTWATVHGSSDRTIMIEAHADEIGFMVKNITKEGFLYLDRVGGSDAATARGKRIQIFGDQGTVLGVIGNTAIHIRPRSGEKVPEVHELWVDIGAKSSEEVAEMGIRVGHPIVYQETYQELANDLICGRALDNRVGGFIIAEVLREIHESGEKPAWTVIAANAVQEEIGCVGAKMITHRLKPDIALVTDVTHATDTPGINHKKHGKVELGKGPSITHGTANQRQMVEQVIQVAKEASIPLQHESSSRFSGTDTDSIYPMHGGTPSALVSLPLRSMHSVVETASYADIKSVIKLMKAFIESLDEKTSFELTL